MGSARINAVRQRLGLRVDTLRKTVSGPVRKDIGKFKSKQKFDSIVRDKEQQEFYGDVLEKGGPRLDVEGTDPAMDEFRAGDPMAVQLDFEIMPYGSKQNKKGVISWKQTKKTIPPSRVEGTSPVPDYEISEDGGGLVELPSKDSELGEKLRAERRDNKFNVYPTSQTKGRGTSITKPNAEKWAKSARIQMARERLGAVGAIDLQSILLKHTGRARKMKGKHFLTTGGELTKPFEMHRNVLADSKVGHDVQEFLRNTGALRIKSDIRFQEGLKDTPRRTIRDDGISSDPDAWLEIETEKKITPKQLNTINKHIKRYDIPENHITLIDSSPNSEATNQFPRGIATVKPENMMKRRRATHTKNIIDQLQNEKYPSQEQLRESKLRQRIAGLGFRERILNWLKEQPRFKSFDPDSSFVGTVKYDQDNQSMQIELNGKKYDFCNVEERLFDSFSGAGSKGAFFNREIKSLHNCGAW